MSTGDCDSGLTPFKTSIATWNSYNKWSAKAVHCVDFVKNWMELDDESAFTYSVLRFTLTFSFCIRYAWSRFLRCPFCASVLALIFSSFQSKPMSGESTLLHRSVLDHINYHGFILNEETNIKDIPVTAKMTDASSACKQRMFHSDINTTLQLQESYPYGILTQTFCQDTGTRPSHHHEHYFHAIYCWVTRGYTDHGRAGSTWRTAKWLAQWIASPSFRQGFCWAL